MEIVRKFNKKETMLTENIGKDHHFNMVIGIVEITLEAEDKYSEYFLSHEEDLELRREELVTRSSIETIGSCYFETDNLIMLTGIVGDNPYLGIFLKEGEIFMQELVTISDKEELACLNSQEKTGRRIFKTDIVMKN